MTTLRRHGRQDHGRPWWSGVWRVAAASVAGLLLMVTVVGAQQEGGSATKDDAPAAEAKPAAEPTLKIKAPESVQQRRQGQSLASLAATIKLGDAASGSREIVITNENLAQLGEGGLLTTASGPGASLEPLLGSSGADQRGRGVGPQQIAAQEQKVEALRTEYEKMSELNTSVQNPYNPYSPHYRAGGVENPLQQKAEQLKSELDQAERQLEQMREQRRRAQEP